MAVRAKKIQSSAFQRCVQDVARSREGRDAARALALLFQHQFQVMADYERRIAELEQQQES